jgi:glycogen synthase
MILPFSISLIASDHLLNSMMGIKIFFCAISYNTLQGTVYIKYDSFSYDKPVEGKKINWMKAGIQECDMLLTVSPYYAEELCSGVDRGVELDKEIESKIPSVKGIVNGMDVNEWNPAIDKFIAINYDATTVSGTSCCAKFLLLSCTRRAIVYLYCLNNLSNRQYH